MLSSPRISQKKAKSSCGLGHEGLPAGLTSYRSVTQSRWTLCDPPEPGTTSCQLTEQHTSCFQALGASDLTHGKLIHHLAGSWSNCRLAALETQGVAKGSSVLHLSALQLPWALGQHQGGPEMACMVL